jgi:AcrR family transcriptional regulator
LNPGVVYEIPTRTELTGKAGRPLSLAAGRAILAASCAILAEAGYAGLSIEQVARRAGVTRQTIYRRWPSKIELVAAVLAMSDDEATSLPDTGDLHNDLVLLARRFSVHKRPGGSFLHSLIAEAQFDPKLAGVVDEYTASRRRQALSVIQRARERGELRPNVSAETLTDLFYGFAWYRRLITRTTMVDADYERMVDSLLHGALKERGLPHG